MSTNHRRRLSHIVRQIRGVATSNQDVCPPEARANGGCKKETDIPLLPIASSLAFKSNVDAIVGKIRQNEMETIASVLNFTVDIFSLRHPTELRELVDNLEAVERAKNGAVDGSIDANSSQTNEDKFKRLKNGICAGNVSDMYKVSVAAISLISMFHIDQLPELLSIHSSMSRRSGTNMCLIKSVSVWALQSFAKFHPDVVVQMGLVKSK